MVRHESKTMIAMAVNRRLAAAREVRHAEGGGPQEKLKAETLKAEIGKGGPVVFLTRFELAEALKISVKTVDTMLICGELPHLRLNGNFIRFYLPDVVRHLSATAMVSKRRWAGPRRGTTGPGTTDQRTKPKS
jgi:excisionase family DNA binding protein